MTNDSANSGLHRFRINDFCEESASTLSEQLRLAIQAGQQAFPLEIDSVGGDAYSLCAILDEIEAAKEYIQVATICAGKAMSCGAILLACGSRGFRFAGPRSTILIHSVQAQLSGSLGELQVDMKESARLNKMMLKTLEDATGTEASVFAELIGSNCDVYLTPKRAKSLGMVDHVRTPLFLSKLEAGTVVL